MFESSLVTAASTVPRILLAWGWAFVGPSAARAQAELPTFLQRPAQQHVRVLCYNVNWDAIFEDGDPDNHSWREFDRSDQFVRVVQAVQPDIVCVQEINQSRDPQDVADILDAAVPLGEGQSWRAHNGSDNVICSRWDLSMLATDTVPSTNRGQAMALVDLPDSDYDRDLYLMNAHCKASGGESNIERRQQHGDAIANWMRDIRSPGGHINLEPYTPVIVLGDLNVYNTDPHYHLTTIITGDIVDEQTYGPDFPPDWDSTNSTDALPLHNAVGPDTYTWRDDSGSFDPGALDRIVYTDTVLSVIHSFVLNTTAMSAGELAAAGLQTYDVVLDPPGGFDHLPLVVDFAVAPVPFGDADRDGHVTLDDYAVLADCMTTPDQPASTNCVASFDSNGDGDVDLWDAMQVFGGFEG